MAENKTQMHRKVILTLVGLFSLVVLAWGAIYGWSEIKLRSYSLPPPFAEAIPSDSASIERGRHIAQTRGCIGCHGKDLEGQDFSEIWPKVGRPVALNLAEYARENDAQIIEAATRRGIGRDGRALWSMPSFNFTHLTDQDVAAVIAFLQSIPVVKKDLPSPDLNLRTRWAMIRGAEKHMPDQIAELPALIERGSEDSRLERGEYIAMTTCNECHGLDVRGAIFPDFFAPDLAVVIAYSKDDFRSLMKEGVGLGGRKDLGLMTIVARERFSHFTDEELEDLHMFLQSLSGRPVLSNVFWRVMPN